VVWSALGGLPRSGRAGFSFKCGSLLLAETKTNKPKIGA
jgi:hypothetical protein